MKKILCIDFCSFKGHHETYFMKVLSTLVENGFYVFAYTGDNSKLIENISNQNLQNCQVLELRLSIGDKLLRHCFLFLDQMMQILSLKSHLRFGSLCNLIATNRLKAQIGEEVPVFFAHIDSILPNVPSFMAKKIMPACWSGIYIQPSYRTSIHLGHLKSREQFLAEKNFALPSCQSIFVLDSTYQTFFKKVHPTLNCIFLPELCLDIKSSNPDDSDNLAPIIQNIKARACGRKIISILGALTRKKNLLLFLEAIDRLDTDEYFPLVIGELRKNQYSEEEIKTIYQLVEKHQKNGFFMLDYHIPNEKDFDHLIRLSDIIYLQYKNHPFSSNILIRALMHRKAVIVSPGYLLEKLVNQYSWQAVAEEDCGKIIRAIQDHLSQFKIDEDCFNQFKMTYSEERFSQVLLEGINPGPH